MMASVTLEEYELLGDSKYRSYVSAVDKALRNFEYTSEWADLISALGKLNKVLTNHLKYPVVPRRITVSKRLAQCLHPALPSGVHLKALETYDIVFKCIGTNRLSQELFIYSAGLFPLLGNAAMNVRPALLNIYETHFAPLATRLRPGLSGFLTGVLSGLEEASEYHDRTNALLEKVCEGVQPDYFYGCLWECVLANPNVRLPATLFVTSHFNKKKSMEDQLYIIGTNVDVLVQALCAAVQDSSVLVQRSVLDLFLLGFPMHNSQLIRSDMERIQTAAVGVVLRRDMSLNRRLWSWLLGSEVNMATLPPPPLPAPTSTKESVERQRRGSVASTESGSMSNAYFDVYSKDLLVQALRTCLKGQKSSTISDVRPYRILVSLLDKPEVGATILDDVLIEVFRALHRECHSTRGDADDGEKLSGSVSDHVGRTSTSTKHGSKLNSQIGGHGELLKAANLLFGTFEPFYIWEYVGMLYSKACTAAAINPSRDLTLMANKVVLGVGEGAPSVLEMCELVEFLLEVVSIETYVEIQTEHLPELLHHLVASLTQHVEILSARELRDSLHLCSRILAKVQPPVVTHRGSTNDVSDSISEDTIITHNLPVDDEETVDDGKSIDAINDNDITKELPNLELRSPSCQSPDFSARRILIRNCISAFQEFFVQFVTRRIFLYPDIHHTAFERIIVPSPEHEHIRKEQLERMLWRCLDGERKSADPDAVGARDDGKKEEGLEKKDLKSEVMEEVKEELLVPSVGEFVDAFTYACQILVEFSSFPMYCTQNINTAQRALKSIGTTVEILDWLRVLIVVATNTCHVEFEFSAIATLLDLITITNSVAQETTACELMPVVSTPDSSGGQGTVAVVIVPLLEATHLSFINSDTYFYEVVAKHLWDQLGDKSLCYHRRSADLLNQLHGLAPTDKLVEDVICRAMARGDEPFQVESFRRFAALWHLTRDLPVKSGSSNVIRMYDRCLFMMLDCLQTDVGPRSVEVHSWFTHSLQRGDIARILEPILLVLLHPDTARVSVQHINIQQPRKVRLMESVDDGAVAEAKIYAISSVEGHVFYHVSDEPRHSQAIKSNSSASSAGTALSSPRRVFALTSLASETSSEVVTANAGLSDFDLPSSHEHGVSRPILLFINPIGGLWGDDIDGFPTPSSCVTVPDLKNARRVGAAAMVASTVETMTETVVGEEKRRSETSFDALESPDENEATSSTEELPTSEIVESILDELVTLVCQMTDPEQDEVTLEEANRIADAAGESFLTAKNNSCVEGNDYKLRSDSSGIQTPENVSVHPLHTHLLLYCQVYDSRRVLYALGLLRSILRTNSRLVLCTMSTSNPGGSRSPRQTQLHNLLARHRRSVFGKGFHGELPVESVTVFRNSMLVEVLISICLYFVRGFYPNLAQMKLTDEEISGNREVQLAAVEVLTLLFTELLPVVKDSGRGFARYIRDLLSRCRVQKALLHCLLSNVYAAGSRPSLEGAGIGSAGSSTTFTEAILEFNEVPRRGSGSVESSCDYSEAFQVSMLRLLLMVIILEDQVAPQKGEDGGSGSERQRAGFLAQGSTVRYQQDISIPCQPMFLSAVLCAIKQHHTRHLHRHWLALVTSALPYLGRCLSQVVIIVINQLCHNLEALAAQYKKPSRMVSPSEPSSAPIDFVMTILDGLTTLCHYCVLDTPLQVAMMVAHPPSSAGHSPSMQGPNAGQIIHNLINVFTPSIVQKAVDSAGLNRDVVPPVDPLLAVRRSLLSNMPRTISALATMWQAVQTAEKLTNHDHPCWIMGTPKAVKQRILEFLSPITHHHGVSFLAAVGVVWSERRKKSGNSAKRVIPAMSDEQLVLVSLVSAIKVMPLDTLIQTVRSVMKQPPATNSMATKNVPLEVSVLQFFFSYVQTLSGSALIESWPSLLGLLKEGLQLNLAPPAQFLLLGILNEFVQNAASFEDKKDQKDLQEISQKLIESVSAVAGACLEQTTWLRRSLAVKPGPQLDIPDSDSDLEDPLGPVNSTTPRRNTDSDTPTGLDLANVSGQHSVQALSILAELLAPLLDVIYMSDEKEKVIPLLTSLMYNVTPYLKDHNHHNMPSFRACSQLLANLSSYQYTRKAWRRDALDLLLDPSFFQMTEICLKYWQTTVDNLMTHDKTTFRDLMARIPMTQSASLSLFSSREQENEQRAQLLKRLAFVIFSGEMDQYQQLMPDIQERLSESLRLAQVPSVQSQVFLCFRVLLLRMSPHQITSLWPIIITEMVQVFLQIEQELNTDSEEFRHPSSHLHRLSTLDSSWVVSPNNGLNAHNHPAWYQLYLAVCKLLDLAVTLPADRLPQFQMYRWAFVGEWVPPNLNNNDSKSTSALKSQNQAGFVPHITRLAYHLNKKMSTQEILPMRPGQPLLTMSSIKSLSQLQPFFNTLAVSLAQTRPTSPSAAAAIGVTAGNVVQQPSRQGSDEALLESLTSSRSKNCSSSIEKIVQRDFLESLGNNS